MSDAVVTVPLAFGWDTWCAEGDLPGSEWSGNESFFWLGGHPPRIDPGERVYIVHAGRLRGYAPLVRIERQRGTKLFAFVRRGDAVAVTIDEHIRGFQGFRKRWWAYAHERSYDFHLGAVDA